MDILIDKIYLLVAFVGTSNSGTSFHDRTDSNRHIGVRGGSCNVGTLSERCIHLVAGGISIAIGIGTAQGGSGNRETLTIDHDGHMRYSRRLTGQAWLREANAVKVEETYGALGLRRAPPPTADAAGVAAPQDLQLRDR